MSGARVPTQAEIPVEPPRRVTVFELFFDLVFVFALTRVTALVNGDPTVTSIGRGLLLLALLWWAWGAYAWLTNAVDTDSAGARLVILGAMGALLIVAVAVPDASGHDAWAFAFGYFVVRVLHLVLYAVAGGSFNRAAILRLAPGNLAASLLLIVGVFVPPIVQVFLWVIAVMIDYGTPLITGVGGFTVHAGHFAERHSLFVIIALGESVVAIGAGALSVAEEGPAGITASLAIGILLAIGVIGGLWWVYFDREAEITQRVLSIAQGPHRAHLARDMFSYLHFPLVVGIVFIAVGVEGVMEHPTEPLHGVYPYCLGAGAALFLIDLGALRWRRGNRPRPDHMIGAAVCLTIIPLAMVIPGLVSLGLLAVVQLIIAVMDRNSTIHERIRESATTAQN